MFLLPGINKNLKTERRRKKHDRIGISANRFSQKKTSGKAVFGPIRAKQYQCAKKRGGIFHEVKKRKKDCMRMIIGFAHTSCTDPGYGKSANDKRKRLIDHVAVFRLFFDCFHLLISFVIVCGGLII